MVYSQDLPKYKIVNMFRYLGYYAIDTVLYLCSIQYLDDPVTLLKGPATNYSIKKIRINFLEVLKSKGLAPHLEFDLILSFKLNYWPHSAANWLSRPRLWPSDEVVKLVVQSCCSVVPKTDVSDSDCWRLSFSQGELVLADHLPAGARLIFLAVKLFFKQKLKPNCSLLKSYRIKTMFYHFLEKNTIDLKNDETAIFSFLSFMKTCREEEKKCPHFFIESVNLFSFPCNTNIAASEFNQCVMLIEDTLTSFPSSIYDLMSSNSRTDYFKIELKISIS